MSALGCLLLYDTGILMEWAELGVAMCLEAQRGVRHAFHPDLHRVRDLSYQGDTAARVLEHVKRERDPRRPDQHGLPPALASPPPRGPAPPRGRGRRDPRGQRAARAGRRRPGSDRGPPGGPERPRPRGRELGPRAPPQLAEPDLPGPDPDLRGGPRLTSSRGDRPPELPRPAELPPDAPDARGGGVLPRDPRERRPLGARPSRTTTRSAARLRFLSCCHRALAHAREVLEVEINSATDNPLLFPPEPPGGFDSLDVEAYDAWIREPELRPTPSPTGSWAAGTSTESP